MEYTIYPAKKDGQWVGAAVESSGYGVLAVNRVLVGFDADGKIYDYSLLVHAETRLGSADWLKRRKGSIKGMNPGVKLRYGKDGGQIDAITVSRALIIMCFHVNAAYAAYKGDG